MHFDFVTFVIQVINLLVVYYVLKLILYKPVTRLLENRRRKVDETLDTAARTMKSAEELMARYQEQIKGAQSESQAIIERAAKMADQLKSEIVSDAHRQAQKILTQATAEIEREKAAALQEIKSEVGDLAVRAASRILERNVTDADQERLVQDLIASLGEGIGPGGGQAERLRS